MYLPSTHTHICVCTRPFVGIRSFGPKRHQSSTPDRGYGAGIGAKSLIFLVFSGKKSGIFRLFFGLDPCKMKVRPKRLASQQAVKGQQPTATSTRSSFVHFWREKMKAVVKPNSIKVQMTKAQEQLVRKTLNCEDRVVQFAGGVMYEQGGGWYAIFAEPQKFDWATDMQMMKALLRKIRSILAPEIKVETVKAYVAPEPEVEIEFVTPSEFVEQAAKPNRLEWLAKVVNSKFHR